MMAQQTAQEFPAESYMRDPEEPFSPDDEVFRFVQLTSFYDVPGEFGHLLEGRRYGFEALSFIITETHPGGGPPLHTHSCEEAHIVLAGTAGYVLGDQRFTVAGPYVVKIPAGVPHTFLNIGDQPFQLIAVFPDAQFSYEELGPNPLVAR
jgi:mannose-6-phosphate isomerase-like protein (cupin superfamily)